MKREACFIYLSIGWCVFQQHDPLLHHTAKMLPWECVQCALSWALFGKYPQKHLSVSETDVISCLWKQLRDCQAVMITAQEDTELPRSVSLTHSSSGMKYFLEVSWWTAFFSNIFHCFNSKGLILQNTISNKCSESLLLKHLFLLLFPSMEIRKNYSGYLK